MIKYRNRYESYTEPCSVGDGTEVEFSFDELGELVPVGRVNVQAIIDSHEEECDIGYLLSRAMNGDQSALSQRIGQYIDTCDLPDNLCEALKQGDSARIVFESLTDEQKAMFNEGKFDDLSNSLNLQNQKPDERDQLVARLKELTGKEVIINE